MTRDCTISDLLTHGIRYFTEHSMESPRTDAEILLSHVLSMSRAWIYSHMEEPAPRETAEEYTRTLSLRAEGTPVQYITGSTDFYNVTLLVNPHVLIPRPETEVLVSHVLLALRQRGVGQDERPLRFLDLGTGSGAIALAVAYEFKGELPIEVVATDVSSSALEVARENVERYDLEGVIELRCGDMFGALRKGESFDAIVSNPPYLSRGDLSKLSVDVRDREPHVALVSGPTGFEHIEIIVREGHRYLQEGGILLFEMGMGQEGGVKEIFQNSGKYENVSFIKDLSGTTRIAMAFSRDAGEQSEGGNSWRSS